MFPHFFRFYARIAPTGIFCQMPKLFYIIPKKAKQVNRQRRDRQKNIRSLQKNYTEAQKYRV